MNKVRAYVLEYLKDGDDGKPKIVPSEVAIRYYCSVWNSKDSRNEALKGEDDPLDNISVKEYPDCIVEFAQGSSADTWYERLGVDVDWEDVENCGGAWYGRNDTGIRVRVRREDISGEWSQKTENWLARNPFVILGMACDF